MQVHNTTSIVPMLVQFLRNRRMRSTSTHQLVRNPHQRRIRLAIHNTKTPNTIIQHALQIHARAVQPTAVKLLRRAEQGHRTLVERKTQTIRTTTQMLLRTLQTTHTHVSTQHWQRIERHHRITHTRHRKRQLTQPMHIQRHAR